MRQSITSLSLVCCTALALVALNSTGKAGEIWNAITIAKVVATPTPAPASSTLKLAKKTQTKTTQTKTAQVSALSAVSTGTTVPFEITIESGFWPTGVTSVSATAKCFQVTSLNNGSTPSISLSSTQLAVFPNGTTSYSTTLTPGTTKQVNLTFPTSTAGKQLAIIITGTGFDDNDDPFSFAGQQGVVVNP